MKRTALIAAQILFVPVAAVSALELYQFLVDAAPSLDFRALPYGSVAVNVIFETLAAAVVAALVALWVFRAFGGIDGGSADLAERITMEQRFSRLPVATTLLGAGILRVHHNCAANSVVWGIGLEKRRSNQGGNR